MSDWGKRIIPLNDTHQVFSVFGVDPSSREVQRWQRDDGFRQVDFEGILNQSSRTLIVDWREWLQDAVDVILQQLGELGIDAVADLDEEGVQGDFEAAEQSMRIKYVPADEDDFDQVIAAINNTVDEIAHYRKFQSCEGSDGWRYAILKNEDWETLESVTGATLKLLFVKV
jgi:hypothetical protein